MIATTKMTGVSDDVTRVRNPLGSSDDRLKMCSGHIVHVSVTHDCGTLELDTGEKIEFSIADRTQDDAKDLHVGDHAWVTVNATDQEPRVLLCPTRNKMLRVRLSK